MRMSTAADGHRFKGQILLHTRHDFVAVGMKTADVTRPLTPVEISGLGGGLRVCLDRDRLACRRLAPVLLGWLDV